jgi:hypothetical protein
MKRKAGIDIEQVLNALERARAHFVRQADALHAQHDYSAEFPANDAEQMARAIELVKVWRENFFARRWRASSAMSPPLWRRIRYVLTGRTGQFRPGPLRPEAIKESNERILDEARALAGLPFRNPPPPQLLSTSTALEHSRQDLERLCTLADYARLESLLLHLDVLLAEFHAAVWRAAEEATDYDEAGALEAEAIQRHARVMLCLPPLTSADAAHQ